MIEFFKRVDAIHDFIVNYIVLPMVIVVFVVLAIFGGPAEVVPMAAVLAVFAAAMWAWKRYGNWGFVAVLAITHAPLVIWAYA